MTMPKKYFFLTILITLVFIPTLSAQQNVRTFIFGHSLINHEFQVNPTPSQETSVPHWLHFLAEAGVHEYAVSGQYGFLPQHANVPPIAQWGFDVVEGAWDSDNEPFSAADFTDIVITPGNFIQWQAPSVNYPNESISPLDATNTVFDWCKEQEDGLNFYIYENWPDMGGYLNNGFPPSPTEWANYNTYLQNDFHDWFLTYHDSLIQAHPNVCVKMIPVGPVISTLLQKAPFDQIPIDTLYEDDAPHGRPTIYFLAALATYMAIYEEKAPADYRPPNIIDQIITDNYTEVVDHIWAALLDFNIGVGESRVFCTPVITTTNTIDANRSKFKIFPNPVSHQLEISEVPSNATINIFDTFGQLMYTEKVDHSTNISLAIDQWTSGVYWVQLLDAQNESSTKHFLKIPE